MFSFIQLPKLESLSPINQRIWKQRARKPVPRRSPRAVRYGMEKLSGSMPRPHIQWTIQSARYRRSATCSKAKQSQFKHIMPHCCPEPFGRLALYCSRPISSPEGLKHFCDMIWQTKLSNKKIDFFPKCKKNVKVKMDFFLILKCRYYVR